MRMAVKRGDVLTARKGIIVHGCNCEGVMGAGIARTIADRFPAVYDAYSNEHKANGLKLGTIIPVQLGKQKWIVNAMTQAHTSSGGGNRPVSYDAVAECFERIEEFATKLPQPLPILFPAIGAGLGGGNWEIIKHIISNSIDDRRRHVLYVYNPGNP
jgi:O-acetyl-ADP-ribose deacetylase (regulator of RNase III)